MIITSDILPYVGISGMVCSINVCGVMSILSRSSNNIGLGGFEKSLVLPSGAWINGFVFWATIQQPSNHDWELLKDLTEHIEVSTDSELSNS